MKLVVTIKQGPTRKPVTIESPLSDVTSLAIMRAVFEAEQTLNSLPGTNTRWHFSIEDDELSSHVSTAKG